MKILFESSVSKKYCNETDFINKYNVLIRYSTLKYMILFYFYVTNQFSENSSRNYWMLYFKFDSWIQQWMFYSNSVIKSDYWRCSWIWLHVQFYHSQIWLHVQCLSYVIYKNWSHFFNKFSFLYNVLYSTKIS